MDNKPKISKKLVYAFWVIVGLVVIGMIVPGSEEPTVPQQQAQVTNTGATETISIESIVSDSLRGYDISKVETSEVKTDSGETISVLTVQAFEDNIWSDEMFVRTSGMDVAELVQAVFSQEDIDRLDVSFELTYVDRYGAESREYALGYEIASETAGKINWNNFNGSDLCTFLYAEGALDPNNSCTGPLAIMALTQ